jgi:hypothetical protein
MPRVFGLPEPFRDAQLDVRQGHDGVGTDQWGGLARELVGAHVPGGASMSFNPGQIDSPATRGSTGWV